MRVIAGLAKGCSLKSVSGSNTRPITDRVKQALFGVLGSSMVGTRFLDLFAGTGSVGIEALSRGAVHATFVERDPRAIRTIAENLKVTGFGSRARLVREDVFRFLAHPSELPFHTVYVAPPQYQGLWARTMLELDKTSHLVPEGLAVAQIFHKEYSLLDLARFELVDQRRYGSTLLCFYQSAAGPDGATA